MKRSKVLKYLILGFLVLGVVAIGAFFIIRDKVIFTVLEPNYEVAVFDNYEEKGAICKEGNKIKGFHKCDYQTSGEVNSMVVGIYNIDYKYKNKKITRKLSVVDKDSPIINLDEGSLKVCPNQQNDSINLVFNAQDNYDGDITGQVVTIVNDGVATIRVKDSSQNETIITKNLIYEDLINPTIELKGSNPYYLIINENYQEPGYAVSDNCDQNITNKLSVTNNINPKKEGTYQVTYSVSDETGNKATATRTVKVITKKNQVSITPSNKTIYLTFDDGPGRYTEELLSILKRYNVKATFFVTNQFPKYKDCIKKAYDDGHGIALHTYTHQWNIYGSRNAYFNDLNKISNLVKSQINQEVYLLRFPGGSGNTVSRNYKSGIMSTLTAEVQLLGYKYFDWNIDSRDTSTSSAKVVASNVIGSLAKNNTVNIVLLHDIKRHSVDAIAEIIEYGLANGFAFDKLTMTSPTVHSKVRN